MIIQPKPPIELRAGYQDKKHLGLVAQLKCLACKIKPAARKTRLELHHKIGCGLGKKASDLMVLPLCNFHHQSGGVGEAIHKGLAKWESNFNSQDDLILQVHDILGITIYKEFLNIKN